MFATKLQAVAGAVDIIVSAPHFVSQNLVVSVIMCNFVQNMRRILT